MEMVTLARQHSSPAVYGRKSYGISSFFATSSSRSLLNEPDGRFQYSKRSKSAELQEDINEVDFIRKAKDGQCVSTTFGTGILRHVRNIDGMHIVDMEMDKVGYVHPQHIVGVIKAVCGQKVGTKYGDGTVVKYDWRLLLYTIEIQPGYYPKQKWRMLLKADEFTTDAYRNVVQKPNAAYSLLYELLHEYIRVICKVYTIFGEASLLHVRKDHIYVCRMQSTIILHLQRNQILFHERNTSVRIGDKVPTAFGTGIVLQHRMEDDIVHVRLPWHHHQYIHMYVPSERVKFLGKHINRPISSLLSYTRKSMKGFRIKDTASDRISSVRQKLRYLSGAKSFTYQLGERVLTPMGSGYVKCIRYDDSYVIKLRRLSILGYFQESSLSTFPYQKVSHYIVQGRRRSIHATSMSQLPRQIMRQVTSVQALSTARLRK